MSSESGILIGMDEAGYGPNLGPLVVAATAWEAGPKGSGFGVQGSENAEVAVATEGDLASAARPNLAAVAQPLRGISGNTPRPGDLDLYGVLQDVVVRDRSTDDRIAIADSKALYKPGGGLRQLERGVHTALASIGRPVSQWSELVDALAADPANRQQTLPWHEEFDCPLPVDATADELSRLCTGFDEVCRTSGLRPIGVRARLVQPAEFNELTEHHGSKGAALSHVTIGLLRELVDHTAGQASSGTRAGSRLQPPVPRPPSPFFVVCDKHGGRNRYHSLLQHHFPESWIDTLVESRAESQYHWGPPEEAVEVAFRMGGEAFLPTALASMTAKYVRELAMRALNEYWCARVPGLRPTAGYPVDARRFKTDIEATQRDLQIDDHVLWRNR